VGRHANFQLRACLLSYRPRVIRRGLLVGLALALLVPAASIAAAPSGAKVPPFTLKLLQKRFGDQTYVPTRLPLRYRYARWQQRDGKLVLTFKERTSSDSFRFEVSKLAPCDGGGAFNRILQVDGNKVYYGGDKGDWIAWRCVVSPKTKISYVLRVLSRGKLPDVALAQVAASGKRFARP
jgi:hypothetical protein